VPDAAVTVAVKVTELAWVDGLADDATEVVVEVLTTCVKAALVLSAKLASPP
jgi:hypothetical protein